VRDTKTGQRLLRGQLLLRGADLIEGKADLRRDSVQKYI